MVECTASTAASQHGGWQQKLQTLTLQHISSVGGEPMTMLESNVELTGQLHRCAVGDEMFLSEQVGCTAAATRHTGSAYQHILTST
jgi:hypothetical protein